MDEQAKTEAEILREHIVWLSSELEKERLQNRHTIEFLKQLINPEDLGHAISNEVKQLAYQLLINHHHAERSSWQSNN
jgi:hypothetical protein